MKLTCTQENLRSALTSLERVVGKQSTLPILSNILLETDKGQLRLSATNLEIGVITSIGAKIEAEGKITVPAKLLIQFIQNLPNDQTVILERVGMQAILTSGNYTIKMNGLDEKDFPIIPEKKSEQGVMISAASLREGLQKTLYCVSLNESRPELTGVFFTYQDERLLLVATDSFRLAEWRWQARENNQWETFFTGEHSAIIIPNPVLQEVSRLLGASTEDVELALEENQLFFTIGQTHIVSRLINGRFPEYQAIIPKQFSLEITVSKSELQRALKIATTFSSYSSGEILFHVNPDGGMVEISSNSQGVGEQVASVPFTGNAAQILDIFFNPRYILDVLSVLDGEMIVFSVNSGSTPVKIASVEGSRDYTYIVMPIRK